MSRVTLVCGMAQEGKTTRALELIEREAVRGICLDVVRSKALARIPRAWADRRELAAFLLSPDAGGRWVGCLRSSEFLEYVWTLRAAPYLRHCTLLIDEALTFATAPESAEPLIHLARMNAHFGGGLGVPVILTAQRPLDLPPDVRSQVTRIVSFRQREPRDLQWIGAFASPEFAAQVFELGPHEALVFPSSPSITPSTSPSAHSPQPEDAHEGRNPGGRRRGATGARGIPVVPEGQLRGEDQAAHQVTGADVAAKEA